MIVYAGKQFWNDFNNGDEALFQDANRPRDDDKFKIRPWFQSGKWDWRSANKNTDFSHIMIKWWVTVAWTWDNKQLLRKIPKLQETWTESEISAIGTPSWAWATPESMKMEKQNNPFVLVKKGTVTYQTWDWSTWFTTESVDTTYFEIAQSWLYYVMCYGTFYFDTTKYSSSTSYQYKEWVGLAQDYWGLHFINTDRTQTRCCGNGDNVRFLQISRFPKWWRLLPMVAHSFTQWTNFVFWSIAVIRLW